MAAELGGVVGGCGTALAMEERPYWQFLVCHTTCLRLSFLRFTVFVRDCAFSSRK